MKIVFLAGPYRGRGEPGEIERNLAQSARFQAALAHAGIVAYSPNIHDAHWETLNGGSEQAAKTLRQITEMVFKDLASALAVMPGWETSVGTKREVSLANERGLPIFYLQDERDIAEIKKWYDESGSE